MGAEISAKQGGLLQAAEFLRVATMTSGGDPYLTPVRFHFDGEALYFVSPEDSRELLYLKANRRVALMADHSKGSKLEGIVVQGLAQFVRGQAEHDRVLNSLRERYPSHGFEGALIKVVPLRVYDLPEEP